MRGETLARGAQKNRSPEVRFPFFGFDGTGNYEKASSLASHRA
jgi:hypothetical protein